MIDRDKFKTELKLRMMIREILEQKNNRESFREKLQEEVKFRNFVRQVLKKESLNEVKTKIIPYDSTGIAILADVIKKVIPIIKDDYFSLTTDIKQRTSFRAHIINAVRNSLAPIRNIQGYAVDSSGDASQLLAVPGEEDEEERHYASSGNGDGPPNVTPKMTPPSPPVSLQETQIAIDNDESDGDKPEDNRFIDAGDDKPPRKIKSSEEEDNFAVAGEDGTGRNLALLSYRRIEKVILDGYQTLDRKEDQEDFYDYIIANFKIYFDRWEEELQKNLRER
jgi:hypothetical protein